MTIATTDDQRDVQRSIRSWAASASPVASVRAGTDTGWRTLWPELASLGLFSAGVPERFGGSGSVADLAAMLEESAFALVGGPVVTTSLAAVVIGRAGGDLARRWCEEIGRGDLPCGVALGKQILDGVSSGSAVHLTGSLDTVLGGSDASAVLTRARISGSVLWCLVSPGVGTVTSCESVDLGVPLARMTFDHAPVAEDQVLRGLPEGVVENLAATLLAADCAGVAGWCLRTAVDYAKIREQFGAPIGSFQAVKHLCAEMLCRTEKARAAAWDAAVAWGGAGDSPDEFALAAAVAASIAFDAAVDTAKDCIQVLGGIGFTWEHDAHLYLRRAVASRQSIGGSARWRARVAEATAAGVRRRLRIDLGSVESERAEVRADVAAVARSTDPAVALAESGLAAPHWPAPYGRGADAAHQVLFAQELASAGVASPDLVIGWWAVPTILGHGSPEQIERFAGPTLRGDIVWCQLFSEPEAGSDLAALRTKATRVDGGWSLQGRKIWTSLAREAHWAIALARTDPNVPKHKGITYFLVDMSSPGIRIEPLREITGDAVFNEVYLDEVFVPDDCVVGDTGDGWRLARTTLANERVAMSNGSTLGSLLEEVVKSVDVTDAVQMDRLGVLVADGVVGSILDLRTTLRQLQGQDPGPESSVRKLVGVRHRQDLAEFALTVDGSAVSGPLSKEFLLTRCLSIAGGTTQILSTVAAERILGLPR